MSRIMLVLGLAISIIAHLWLLGLPPGLSEALDVNAPNPETPAMLEAVEVQTYTPPAETPAETPQQPPADAPSAQAQGPQPPLTPAEAVEAEAPADGDFAGRREGVERPAIRIDWGRPQQAAAILAGGRMKLVVLRDDLTLAGELVSDDGEAWQRGALTDGGTVAYSAALRVVDEVPAFAAARRAAALAPGEHLAVMLPVQVERALRQSGLEAATGGGIAPDSVKTFAGRFESAPGGIAFVVTHIQTRATP